MCRSTACRLLYHGGDQWAIQQALRGARLLAGARRRPAWHDLARKGDTMSSRGFERSKPGWRTQHWYVLLRGLIALAAPAVAAAAPCAASCSSGQSCTFNGIKNVALGQAKLAINDACHLVVSNIGASGEDGFSQVALPSHTGEVVTLFA